MLSAVVAVLYAAGWSWGTWRPDRGPLEWLTGTRRLPRPARAVSSFLRESNALSRDPWLLEYEDVREILTQAMGEKWTGDSSDDWERLEAAVYERRLARDLGLPPSRRSRNGRRAARR